MPTFFGAVFVPFKSRPPRTRLDINVIQPQTRTANLNRCKCWRILISVWMRREMRAAIQRMAHINIIVITSAKNYTVRPLRTSGDSSNPRTTSASISQDIIDIWNDPRVNGISTTSFPCQPPGTNSNTWNMSIGLPEQSAEIKIATTSNARERLNGL